MGLLLLLTSTLLLSYFHPGVVVDAKQSFKIRDIILSIEPSTNVTRGTNVTMRCKAIVNSLGQEVLSREYTIYKGKDEKVYNKTSSTSEDLVYLLPEARVSNTGRYKCKINIKGIEMTSQPENLKVIGLAKPVLQLNKYEVNEAEEVTVRCTAPGETGSIYFTFYRDSKEILREQGSSNHFEEKLHFRTFGINKIQCSYDVLTTSGYFESEKSDTVVVSVKELFTPPVLEIFPKSNIYEGDLLNIMCTGGNILNSSEEAHLYLFHDTKILCEGYTKINHSMVALAKDPGEFECSQEIKQFIKVTKMTISVTELFSAPTLKMSPAEVFQKEYMTLTCKSEIYASERLHGEELTYTLEPPDNLLIPTEPGVFRGKALAYNYTCAAQAKGIVKHSKILNVHPKVSVSNPKISVHGKAILGQLIKIRCQSDTGSFPINYTLLKEYEPLSTTTVKLPTEEAIFTVTITKPEELNKYMCEAHNNLKVQNGELSKRLNAAVIEPLSDLTLTVPDLSEISEGKSLYLICGTKGTPPVTFKLYSVGNKEALFTTTSNQNNTNFHIPNLSREFSGTYYCEADNNANNIVRSEKVTIKVGLALWKKALIGGACVLVVLVLGVVYMLYIMSKRVRGLRTAVSVWSERPPEPANDEESSVVSSEPDVEYTEVVHPQPSDAARVPLRKGTDTVYSELKNPPHGAAGHHDYGSVEYAELNGKRPEISHHLPEVNNYQDLPEPVE